MFYPATFEEKIGFDQIRQLLAARCVSAMGRREVEAMQCGVDRVEVENNLLETNEFKQLILLDDPFPLQECHDLLPVLSRIAIDGTFIELDELADLRALLQTVVNVVVYFRARHDDGKYPHLWHCCEEVLLEKELLALGTIPRSEMNFLIQTASFAALDAAIYSASVVESATVSCFELFQLTAPPFKQNTYPDCDLKSS